MHGAVVQLGESATTWVCWPPSGLCSSASFGVVMWWRRRRRGASALKVLLGPLKWSLGLNDAGSVYWRQPLPLVRGVVAQLVRLAWSRVCLRRIPWIRDWLGLAGVITPESSGGRHPRPDTRTGSRSGCPDQSI